MGSALNVFSRLNENETGHRLSLLTMAMMTYIRQDCASHRLCHKLKQKILNFYLMPLIRDEKLNFVVYPEYGYFFASQLIFVYIRSAFDRHSDIIIARNMLRD